MVFYLDWDAFSRAVMVTLPPVRKRTTDYDTRKFLLWHCISDLYPDFGVKNGYLNERKALILFNITDGLGGGTAEGILSTIVVTINGDDAAHFIGSIVYRIHTVTQYTSRVDEAHAALQLVGTYSM